jgi:hypothetical protein
MLNLRFKNPYKINREINNDQYVENEEEFFEFEDLRIYEFNYNNEIAPKGKYF